MSLPTWVEWLLIVAVLFVLLSVLIPGFPININPSPPRELQERLAKERQYLIRQQHLYTRYPAFSADMFNLPRILKYTPAVVLGLLVVMWVMSWFVGIGYATVLRGRLFAGGIADGTVGGSTFNLRRMGVQTGWRITKYEGEPSGFLGRLDYHPATRGIPDHKGVELPIPLLLSLLLPLAIGPFLSFRFNLWHYVAYTTLVAVELAYYLRWQG